MCFCKHRWQFAHLTVHLNSDSILPHPITFLKPWDPNKIPQVFWDASEFFDTAREHLHQSHLHSAFLVLIVPKASLKIASTSLLLETCIWEA